MYTCSLVSIFCSRQLSVKQTNFEIYIILCQYSYHSFFRFLKIKITLAKLTSQMCNFLSSSNMGMITKKCEVWKIYHTEYGPFLATDWLKTQESGRSWTNNILCTKACANKCSLIRLSCWSCLIGEYFVCTCFHCPDNLGLVPKD